MKCFYIENTYYFLPLNIKFPLSPQVEAITDDLLTLVAPYGQIANTALGHNSSFPIDSSIVWMLFSIIRLVLLVVVVSPVFTHFNMDYYDNDVSIMKIYGALVRITTDKKLPIFDLYQVAFQEELTLYFIPDTGTRFGQSKNC